LIIEIEKEKKFYDLTELFDGQIRIIIDQEIKAKA